ncbi:MAG: D-alanyl-D-alanine carboxypeptidase family protein [Cellulosilyticaceae bacterium]
MESIRIVSKKQPLSSTYIPQNLILDPLQKIWLSKDTYYAVYKLTRQMQKEGLLAITLVSGYRSYAYQKTLFDKKVQSLIRTGLESDIATQKVSMIVAMPGCSEHQLGNSIDVTTHAMSELADPLVASFEKTKEAEWLNHYAKDFGFILRYPKDKTEITEIIYEPWHYRYVGINHARKITRLGMCLEEYVESLNIF